jgi:RsiW-degrading membrane proteinase PrsW (M82 family)
LFAAIPPVIWLLVYLREDDHPEPLHLLLLTFLGGVAAAFVALLIQSLLFSSMDFGKEFLLIFAGVAVIEEALKYVAFRLLAVPHKDFDEPIDAMIYMVAAGLGFAAIENFLFLFFKNYDPNLVFGENLITGAQLSAARFIGANQLHALASAILGFFFAKSWFPPKRHFVILGLILASALHAVFNYLIIVKDQLPGGIIYLATLLGFSLIMILIDFHRLKQQELTLA